MEKLDSKELKKIVGGSYVNKEYCENLNTLIANNWETWTEAERANAMAAYNKHCLE